MLAEPVAVLEVELVLARLLDWHGELEASLLGLRGERAAELLVHQAADRLCGRTLLGGLDQAFVDQPLCVRDGARLLLARVALDPEHLLLERAAVVEREDEELAAVVPESHLSRHLPVVGSVFRRLARRRRPSEGARARLRDA